MITVQPDSAAAKGANAALVCGHDDAWLMGELYGELNAADHAAFRARLAECADCRAHFEQLSGTRARIAGLLEHAEPAGLEARILAAAVAKVAPQPSVEPTRGGRVIAMLGRWAMRPQTAMAAVFLLMVGSSALLLRGREGSLRSPVRVVDESPGSAASPMASVGNAADEEAPLRAPQSRAAAARSPEPDSQQGGKRAPGFAPNGEADLAPGARMAALAPPPAVPAASAAAQLGHAEALGSEFGQGGASKSSAASAIGGASVESKAKSDVAAGDGATGTFARGMAAYRARKFDDAVEHFDAATKSGDSTAELWAARSVRDGHGCATALTRLEHAAAANSGSPAGYDATFEAGKCYQAIGNLDAANARFTRIASVPSHADRAASELAANQRIASARAERARAAAGGAVAGPAAAPAARAAPRAAETAPTQQR